MTDFVCIHCGKQFQSTYQGRLYCSHECANVHRKGKKLKPKQDATQQYIENHNRAVAANNRVAAVAVEARRKGMSYGKYQAMHHEEE